MSITDIKMSNQYGINELLRRNSYDVNVTDATYKNTKISWKSLVALNSTNDAKIYNVTKKTYGVSFEMYEKDAKYLILLKNNRMAASTSTQADKVYICKGNDEVFGESDDMEIVVPYSTTATATSSTISTETVYSITPVVIESARFKQMEGDWKNRIVICGSAATIDVAVIRLP